MRKFLFTIGWILLWTSGSMSQSGSVQPLSIGEEHHIYSEMLHEERILNVCLPFDYNAEREYPVIYLLDGSKNEDFLHIAGLVQFFNLMYKMDPHIVVGIENVDRKRDFTCHTDIPELKKDFPTAGHSEAFIQFLENELMPYISSRYRVSQTKMLIGQSLGGLLASEVLLRRPGLFTHYFIISPSLWWDDQSLIAAAPELLPGQEARPEYVYIAVGAHEHQIMVRDAGDLYQALRQSAGEEEKIEFQLMQDEDHATILHNAVYLGFRKIFAPRY